MATTSGVGAAGDPAASSPAPSQPQHPTPRISHIVRTYLDLSSNSKKRRAARKNQLKPGGVETSAAGENKGCGPSGAASLEHSRLLRELGIRVSRYTNEERRDIITRYMQKRSARQGVNRAAAKVGFFVTRSGLGASWTGQVMVVNLLTAAVVACRSRRGKPWRSGAGGVPEGSSSARRTCRYNP